MAAEASGDQLAGRLMAALQEQQPDIVFEGVGGQQMQARGLQSWVPMESLSVMGIVEVLKHLPRLLKIRRLLARRWLQNPPDIFIGVDAPDFNLGLEKRLRGNGITTVHYVCPSIWAWRAGRVKTLRAATDLVLSLFPFEVPLLARHQINAHYAGHPLALQTEQLPNQQSLRKQLSLPAGRPVLALLPGSRMAEVSQLSHDFLETARRVYQRNSAVIFVAPMASEAIQQYFLSCISAEYRELDIRIFAGQSHQLIEAADVVLLASGTATLEAMLQLKPMVVAYKVHWLTYFITFTLGLVKTPFIALPNILAGREIVPELFQDQCRPEALAQQVLSFFTNRHKRDQAIAAFSEQKQQLSQGDPRSAATAVLQLLRQ